MWPDHFDINVSRESLDKLQIYHDLLWKWQKAINLVSPKTIDDAWIRHFADSVQIEKFVSRESKVVADIGSGAGFPGVVLAILRPDLEIHSIESDQRKSQFMRTVSRETKTSMMFHVKRIEDAYDDVAPDLVTARALADLSALLGFVAPWVKEKPNLECIFLKGVKAQEEIEAARAKYSFDCDVRQSITDPNASILHIRNIAVK